MQNNKLELNSKIFKFNFLNFILSRKANGFTLIETLVAVTILSSAVAGPMVLSIKSIGSASVSRDQLVAFYLGQEIVEYVRNVRDTNLINSSSDWLNGLTACKGESGSVGCYIDVVNKNISDCGSTVCPNMNFDNSSKNYNYQPVVSGVNEPTPFIRTVKIDDSARADGSEAKVSVSVKWTGKYGEKTLNLEDNIFNWR